MADFNELKAIIEEAIRENGREEITGDILQGVLLSIVDKLGDEEINTLYQLVADEVAARQGADNTLQGNIDAEENRAKAAERANAQAIADEEIRAKAEEQLNARNITAEEVRAKAAEKVNADDIDIIEGKIPAQASAQNQLADKQYVDDKVATDTATFRGSYNQVTDLGLSISSTHAEVGAALSEAMAALVPPIVPDNNDYCYVQVPDADATPTEIERVDRYKFNGTDWVYEYSIINSGFTAAQWAALNSGITSGLVAKLRDLPTNAQLTTLLNGKEAINNKVTSVSSSSTDTQYPSAKAVWTTITAWLSGAMSWTAAQMKQARANLGFGNGDIDDVPTAESNNVVKSGGVQSELALGAVYDVSAKNPTAGPNNDGKWASLSALLSDANLNTLIPSTVRKGGMSIKYVQSSDNKYVQYRYMGTEITGNPNPFLDTANWQGVDDEPIAGSDNLVKSGGVYSFIKPINLLDILLENVEWTENTIMDMGGNPYSSSGFCLSNFIDISNYAEMTFHFRIFCNAQWINICFYNSNKQRVYSFNKFASIEYTIPNNVKYVRFIKQGSASTPIDERYSIVSKGYVFGTGLDLNNYASKYLWGVGYNKVYNNFTAVGTGKIHVNTEDTFYYNSSIGVVTYYNNVIDVFDANDTLIGSINPAFGTLAKIKISDYSGASYIIVNFGIDYASAVRSGTYLWKESEIVDNSEIFNYIKNVEERTFLKQYVVSDITDFHSQYITLYDGNTPIDTPSNFTKSNSWNWYFRLNINEPIYTNISRRGIDYAVLNGYENNIKLFIQLDICNLGENEIQRNMYIPVVVFRPNVPVKLNFLWNNNNTPVALNMPPGTWSITNIKYYLVNNSVGVSDTFNGISSRFVDNYNGPISKLSVGLNTYVSGKKLVMFGDSIMESNKAISACTLIAARYGLTPINLAHSGSTPTQSNDWNLSDDNLANVPTDAVIAVIAGGTNAPSAPLGDIDDRTDRSTIYGCLNYAIDYILNKNPTCIVVLLGGCGSASLGQWNNGYKTLAEHRGDCLYAETKGLFTNAKVMYYTYDGGHPRTELSVRYAAAAIHEISKVLC